MTEYAKERESRRLMGVWPRVGTFTFILVVAFMHGGGPWVTGLLVVLGVAAAYLTLSVVIPVQPDHLVRPHETPVGVWSASMRARSFEEVVSRRPNTEEFMTLGGKITFHADGTVVWRVGSFSERRFGPLERRWTPPYDLTARRLKGPRHQLHVAIQTGPDPELDVDDVWLWATKNFPI
ncbi:hypothetical protein [Propionibacterium cyclohexanicum]|uniref:hypothetical protein n=1 Tax=Propionibacterium cyclohexanicum TaxID=64702 RepID=UPI00115FFFC6|nr:hypothetical protein [Propionibacterium cyclohexanicum]